MTFAEGAATKTMLRLCEHWDSLATAVATAGLGPPGVLPDEVDTRLTIAATAPEAPRLPTPAESMLLATHSHEALQLVSTYLQQASADTSSKAIRAFARVVRNNQLPVETWMAQLADVLQPLQYEFATLLLAVSAGSCCYDVSALQSLLLSCFAGRAGLPTLQFREQLAVLASRGGGPQAGGTHVVTLLSAIPLTRTTPHHTPHTTPHHTTPHHTTLWTDAGAQVRAPPSRQHNEPCCARPAAALCPHACVEPYPWQSSHPCSDGGQQCSAPHEIAPVACYLPPTPGRCRGQRPLPGNGEQNGRAGAPERPFRQEWYGRFKSFSGCDQPPATD